MVPGADRWRDFLCYGRRDCLLRSWRLVDGARSAPSAAVDSSRHYSLPNTRVTGYSAAHANHLHTTLSTGRKVQPLSSPSTQRPATSKRELDRSSTQVSRTAALSSFNFTGFVSSNSPSIPSCVVCLRFSASSRYAAADRVAPCH